MKIGMCVYPGCVVSGLFAFAEMLEVANQRTGKKQFETIWVGQNQEPVPVSVGGRETVVSIVPRESLLDKSLDAILLPGFWTQGQLQVETSLAAYEGLLSTLKEVPEATRVWAYCSSVCLLAETGRLDNQLATSTWWMADYLQKRYRTVGWRFSQTCIIEPANTTASGVNGYLPIAQDLIASVCGQEVLRDIVDLMVVPKPETNSQPFQFISLMSLEDPLMRQVYVWVENTPAKELTITALARQLNQTERTLARKVKLETGLSCAQFMRLVKLHQAGESLIYSSLPVSAISDRFGFSDDAAFRRTFKKVSNYTPTEYRQTFRR